MRIRNVRLYPVHTARANGDVCQHVVLVMETDNGIQGLGEMSDLMDLPMVAPDVGDLEETLNGILPNMDPMCLEQVERVVNMAFGSRGVSGVYTGNIACGVEMACYDLTAKALNISVARLLGGPVRSKIQACYPLFRPSTSGDVEANLAKVEELLSEEWTTVRAYAGANPEADIEQAHRLREKFGDRVHMQAFDLSGRVERVESLRLLKQLIEVYLPDYVESVCPPDDLRGMAWIRDKLELPVSEHVGSPRQAIEYWQAGAVDVINVAINAFGGIRAAFKMFAVAEALKLRCILSTTQEMSVGTAAVAHLGAAVQNIHYATVAVGPRLYDEDVVAERLRYRRGYLEIPQGTGLGMTLDMKKIEALTIPIAWRGYSMSTLLDDVHDRPWKVQLSPGLRNLIRK